MEIEMETEMEIGMTEDDGMASPAAIDLGPIRIAGCQKITRSGGTRVYQLVLDIGPHEVIIEASQRGNSIRITLDDESLASITEITALSRPQ